MRQGAVARRSGRLRALTILSIIAFVVFAVLLSLIVSALD